MRIAVTSVGMISSVGLGVVPSAAAVRAGASFPGPIEHFAVDLDDAAEAAPIHGHPIHDYTDGFAGVGRCLRIATGCVEDLVACGGLPGPRDASFWQATGLALATPVLDPARFPGPEPLTPERLLAGYGQRLLGLVGLPLQSSRIELLPLGHAGTAAAIRRGAQALQQGWMERVLVLAVDSCLDETTLAWLHERGRLKTGDSPVGLRPGEAGACILLESDAAARRRGAEILAYVAGTAQGEERASLFSGEVNLGAALGAAIASVWPEPAEAELDLLADLNGEEWRARELAGARARLGARLARAHLILPAMSLGETGAASGAVGVCLAVRAFVRGYHHGGQALVTSSAEHGHVAAIRLARS